MNLRDQLLYEHSKANSLEIQKYVGNSQERFDQLFNLLQQNEPVVAQRAAFTIDHCLRKRISFLQPNLEAAVKILCRNDVHDAVLRCIVRAFQDIDLPEDLEGIVLERCYELLTSEKQPVAIRVFSMTVAYRISNRYPELKNELKIIVEEYLTHDSPGMCSRSKRIHKHLVKELKSIV